jgi:hypothetical protein
MVRLKHFGNIVNRVVGPLHKPSPSASAFSKIRARVIVAADRFPVAASRSNSSAAQRSVGHLEQGASHMVPDRIALLRPLGLDPMPRREIFVSNCHIQHR